MTGPEFAGGRQTRQIDAVTLERLVGAFGVLRGHALVAADFAQGGEQFLAGEPGVTEQAADTAGVAGHGQQQVLDRNVVVIQRFGLALGSRQEAGQRRGDRDLALVGVGPRMAGQGGNQSVDLVADRGGVEPGLLKDGRGDAFRLIEDRRQEVLRGSLGVTLGQGPSVTGIEGFLNALGHAFNVHIRTL